MQYPSDQITCIKRSLACLESASADANAAIIALLQQILVALGGTPPTPDAAPDLVGFSLVIPTDNTPSSINLGLDVDTASLHNVSAEWLKVTIRTPADEALGVFAIAPGSTKNFTFRTEAIRKIEAIGIEEPASTGEIDSIAVPLVGPLASTLLLEVIGMNQ